MRWKAALIGCLFLIGCGGDPATSRLAIGSKTIAVEHYKGQGYDGVFLEDTGDSLHAKVVYGTHLTVVDDTADPDRDWGTRKVLVHVEDGERRGMTGKVARFELHPVR